LASISGKDDDMTQPQPGLHSRGPNRRLPARLLAHGSALAVAGLLLYAGVAQAGAFVVTTTSDLSSANASCTAPCSLRQAITDANTATGTNTITFQPGLTGTITLASHLPDINSGPMTITGPGARVLSIDGAGFQTMAVQSSTVGTTTISGLALTNGNTSGSGGALLITPGKTTVLDGMAFVNNHAQQNGGAIWANTADLTIRNSTLNGNSAAVYGGAINHDAPGALTIQNTTITANTELGRGALYATGATAASILDSTITGNTASSPTGGNGAGGIRIAGAMTMTMTGTIVAGNTGADTGQSADIAITGGTLNASYSLIQDPTNLSLAPSDITGMAPLLGALQNNGGQTDTEAPSLTSPVINQGNSPSVAVDQRSLTRPVAYPGFAFAAGGDGSDIGATELQLPPTIAGVAPATGPAGTPVLISGSHFTGATQVLFGAVPAAFTVTNDGQISATAPAGPTGTINIRVTTQNGTSSVIAADQFTYAAASGTPPGGTPPGGTPPGGTPPGGSPPGGLATPLITARAGASTKVKGSGIELDTGLVVKCPAGGPSCTIDVLGVSQVRAALVARKRKTKKLTVTSAHLTLAPGRSQRIKLRLRPKAARVLRRAKRLTVALTVIARSGAGRPVTFKRALHIKAPRKARRRRR